MVDEFIPIHGYMQPGYGVYSVAHCSGMQKKPKEHKAASRAAIRLREKVAENVEILMLRDFPASKHSTPSKREKALAKEAHTSWSTIQRILAPVKVKHGITRRSLSEDDGVDGVGCKIDTIADLAAVFGVSPADLLTPNFALGLVPKESPAEQEESRELHRKPSR